MEVLEVVVKKKGLRLAAPVKDAREAKEKERQSIRASKKY
jgi:hypothetical protein